MWHIVSEPQSSPPQDGQRLRRVAVVALGAQRHPAVAVGWPGGQTVIQPQTVVGAQRERTQAESDVAYAPMAARVLSVCVAANQQVQKGEVVAVLEAMKMEHRLLAPRDGMVACVHVAAGDQVATQAPVISLVVD